MTMCIAKASQVGAHRLSSPIRMAELKHLESRAVSAEKFYIAQFAAEKQTTMQELSSALICVKKEEQAAVTSRDYGGAAASAKKADAIEAQLKHLLAEVTKEIEGNLIIISLPNTQRAAPAPAPAPRPPLGVCW